MNFISNLYILSILFIERIENCMKKILEEEREDAERSSHKPSSYQRSSSCIPDEDTEVSVV